MTDKLIEKLKANNVSVLDGTMSKNIQKKSEHTVPNVWDAEMPEPKQDKALLDHLKTYVDKEMGSMDDLARKMDKAQSELQKLINTHEKQKKYDPYNQWKD